MSQGAKMSSRFLWDCVTAHSDGVIWIRWKVDGGELAEEKSCGPVIDAGGIFGANEVTEQEPLFVGEYFRAPSNPSVPRYLGDAFDS